MTRFYYDTPSALHITIPARYDRDRAALLNILKAFSDKAVLQEYSNRDFYFTKRLRPKYWIDFWFSISQKHSLTELLGDKSLETSAIVRVPPENVKARRIMGEIVICSILDLLCLNEIDFGSSEIEVDSEVRILEHYRRLKGN